MLRVIKSAKFQEEISFFTEDIEWNENRGAMTAFGFGERTGEEYDIIFSEDGTVIEDIRIHNT